MQNFIWIMHYSINYLFHYLFISVMQVIFNKIKEKNVHMLFMLLVDKSMYNSKLLLYYCLGFNSR